MPSVSSNHLSNPLSVQPAARHPPKTPDHVLAEAEAQWIFTEEELARTPSIEDGMSLEQERELRSKGLGFIMQVGIMLKLPQLTLSTAAVFFNRFLMRHSLVTKKEQPKALHHYQIAAVSIFLATKTEENCRKLRELIMVCCRVAQKNPTLMVEESSKDYWRWRDTLLFNEDVMLEALCFDLTVDSPHRLVWELLKSLGAEHNKKLRAAAWGFLNDACLTQLCLRFSARTIAAAAVYASARYCGADTRFEDDEAGRPWWEVRGVKLRQIRGACNAMADVYEGDPTKGLIAAAGAGGEEANGGEEHGQRTSIYVGLRTPLDGPEEDAKTRLRRVPQEPPTTEEQAGWEGPAMMGTEKDGSDGGKADAEVKDEMDKGQKPEPDKRRDSDSSRRRRSPEKKTADATAIKRDRDGTPKVDSVNRNQDSANGVRRESSRPSDPANKRIKQQVNSKSSSTGSSSGRPRSPGHKSPHPATQDDDGAGSEEGELEG